MLRAKITKFFKKDCKKVVRYKPNGLIVTEYTVFCIFAYFTVKKNTEAI